MQFNFSYIYFLFSYKEKNQFKYYDMTDKMMRWEFSTREKGK